MSFCRKCGAELPQHSAFCPSCGTSVSGPSPSGDPAPATTPGSPVAPAVGGSTSRKVLLPITVAVVLVLALGAGGYVLFTYLGERADERRIAAAEAALDRREQKEADALQARRTAQAEVAADLIAAAMTEDTDLLRRCVSANYDDVLVHYRDQWLPSNPDYDVRTEWNDDTLSLTISNGRDELRVDLQSTGDEPVAQVSANFIFNGDFYTTAYGTVELENGQWVVTTLNQTQIEDWWFSYSW